MALKTALLQILEEHRDAPVSGQALADRLHVSRAAVWKAMKALQAEGHRITAVTNRGYQLERDSDVLTPQGIRCRLRPAYQDCAIRVDARVPSTNTQAKKLAADGEAAPSLLLADGQTAGRGRMGRAFFSPPGTGLYMSVLLRPAVQAEELPLVTLAAAAAVCEAVEEAAGVSTRVKWVNDILVDGRKVAGILTEAVGDLESGTMESVVVGIGVNVKTPADAFPEELRERAGSLLPAQVSRCDLAAGIANRLLTYADSLPERRYLEPYRERLAVLGRPVQYKQRERWMTGRAVDLREDGCLLVEGTGGVAALRGGEIRMEGEWQ